MKGADVIESLKRKFRMTKDAALVSRLGISSASLHNWRKRDKVTAKHLAGLVHKACCAEKSHLQQSAIRPVVEFFPITRHSAKKGSRVEVFTADEAQREKHPYLSGLKKELSSHKGIYIFFDSRGQALYVGKARRQHLWNEMTNAFNRSRGQLQTVRRVKHPERRQTYKTSDEVARQIVPAAVPLHELASYFSAYQVSEGLIGELEAMLVRCAPNDLLNKKMERFGQQRRRKSGK